MAMIKIIKNLAKKSQTIVRWHKVLMFLREIPLKDYLNFKKLALVKKVYPYTMVGYLRLSNTYELAKQAEKNRIEGAFVECGVWKGGCSALMGFAAKEAGSGRKIWLFDSFEGLPEPVDKDGVSREGVKAKEYSGKLVALPDDVKEIFSILKIPEQSLVIVKGWFEKTLPESKEKIGKIALLRLDADWYESTKCCLENLYDKVVSGGYVIIDDYGFWQGCRRAVDEFFAQRKINVNLIDIDGEGVYFQKP